VFTSAITRYKSCTLSPAWSTSDKAHTSILPAQRRTFAACPASEAEEKLFEIHSANAIGKYRNLLERLAAVRCNDQWSQVGPDIVDTLDYIHGKDKDGQEIAEPKRRGSRDRKKSNKATVPELAQLIPAIDKEDDYGYGYDVAPSAPPSSAFTAVASPAQDSGTPSITISYNRSRRIEAHAAANPLLLALIQPMLGAVLNGDEMEFSWSKDIEKYSKMDNSLRPRQANSKIVATDEAVPTPDEDFALFVAAGDVSKMIAFRDQGYDDANDDEV
jgi:hypothetical protein